MRVGRLLLIMMGLLPLGVGRLCDLWRRPRPFPGASASAPGATVDKPVAPGAPDAPIAPNAPVAPIAPDLRSRRFDGRAVAEFAMGFRGVPYRWAAPTRGDSTAAASCSTCSRNTVLRCRASSNSSRRSGNEDQAVPAQTRRSDLLQHEEQRRRRLTRGDRDRPAIASSTRRTRPASSASKRSARPTGARATWRRTAPVIDPRGDTLALST